MPQKTRFARRDVAVIANECVADDHYMLTLEEPRMAAAVEPGQFFQVRLTGKDAPFLPRPISLYDWYTDSAGEKSGFRLLYKVIGTGTAALSSLEKGDCVAVTGPLGNGFSMPSGVKRVLILAGGIGIAPFLPLVRKAIEEGGDPGVFHLLYGARTGELIVRKEPFEELGVSVEIATDDGSAGVKGTVMDLLGSHCDLVAPEEMKLYASGPTPMLNVVAAFCAGRGLPGELSLESRMICGIGVCNSCAVAVKSEKAEDGWEYKLVCRDGPVFGAAALHLE